MNPNNYASLEASKRLAEAGIVLETDMIWHCAHGFFELKQRGILNSSIGINYPAPSMAEVWRELPETIEEYDLTCEKTFNGGLQAGYTTYDVDGLRWKVLLNNTNPTDALVDLLIWVRKGASNDHT